MQGRQSITITGFGFLVDGASYKWSDLTEVRTHEIGGRSRAECLVLRFGEVVVDLEAMDAAGDFAIWTAMVADFADQLANKRPEVEVILSPSDSDKRTAFRLGAVFTLFGVLLTAVLLSVSGVWIGAFAGVMPSLVGIVVCLVYWPGRPEKRISSQAFAAKSAK